MTTNIQAIQQLPPHDLAEFRRWFVQFDEVVWDVLIEADAGAGKLDALAAEALVDCDKLLGCHKIMSRKTLSTQL